MFEFQPSPIQPLWYTGLGAAPARVPASPAAQGPGRAFLRILRAVPGWFASRAGKPAIPPAVAPAHRSPSPCGCGCGC